MGEEFVSGEHGITGDASSSPSAALQSGGSAEAERIAKLEAILNSEDDTPVRITPDGRVVADNDDVGTDDVVYRDVNDVWVCTFCPSTRFNIHTDGNARCVTCGLIAQPFISAFPDLHAARLRIKSLERELLEADAKLASENALIAKLEKDLLGANVMLQIVARRSFSSKLSAEAWNELGRICRAQYTSQSMTSIKISSDGWDLLAGFQQDRWVGIAQRCVDGFLRLTAQPIIEEAERSGADDAVLQAQQGPDTPKSSFEKLAAAPVEGRANG